MPGTVRRIIDHIKDVRSGGNSVVALTVETRLVLQGFDPQRFDYDTPDDPARLARIRDVAAEMGVDVDELLAAADVEPDDEAELPAAPGQGPRRPSAADLPSASPPPGNSGAVPEVPADHPLRAFRTIADDALAELGDDVPDGFRSGASFAQLIKASLLMALYSIGSDRVFCDQLRHNSLFRWFLDLDAGSDGFDAQTFGRDREAALDTSIARTFFDRAVPVAGRQKLFSHELLQVNGRRIKDWMSPRDSA